MVYEKGLSMEERATSLFQPDTLLPEQYLDTFRRKLHLEPEKKLMLAILEDAIACFQKYVFARDGKGKALFREAEMWLEDKEGSGVFSFDSICELLGFDPEYLRRGLRQWKTQALVEHTQTKVYQLSPRSDVNRRGVSVGRRSAQRLKRVVNR